MSDRSLILGSLAERAGSSFGCSIPAAQRRGSYHASKMKEAEPTRNRLARIGWPASPPAMDPGGGTNDAS
jgi:hypothetical protein